MTHSALVNPLLFEQGERLALKEFLQRWEQMPDLKFAELIDGVVYTPSPLSYEHSIRDSCIQTLLGLYALRTRVCETLTNATWLMVGSAPQPDLALRVLPEHGGASRLSGKLVDGVPELIVEVCGSTRSFDLGPKLSMYERAGVPEYVTVLIEERRFECRRLRGQEYRIHPPEEDGIIKSHMFPGLWLNERAIWARDADAMLATLEAGLQSDECNGFLARLTRR